MKSVAVLLAFTVLSTLVGCVSKEQRKINEDNSSRAEENALAYIEEKYGFEADVIETEVDSYGGLFGPTFNGYVFVTMEYDDTEFTVYIDGEEENTDGRDNYQQETITDEIKDRLNEIVDAKCDDFIIYNTFDTESSDEHKYYLMTEEYYDGENLDDILDSDAVCRVCYPENADLSALDETYISELFSESACAIYSYKDDKFYDKNTIYGDLTEENYKFEYAMYINEAVTYNHDGYTYYKPEIYNVGDMYYVTEDNMPLEIYEYGIDDIINRWDISNSSNVCTNFYRIPKSDSRVTVFFESDKLPNDGEKCGIIRLTNDSEHDSYCVTDRIGEYNVATLYSHQLECYCAVKDNGIVLDD